MTFLHRAYEFLLFFSILPTLFFLSTISFIFLISSRYLFSFIWTKDSNFTERDMKWKIWERKEKECNVWKRLRCKEGGFVICGLGLYLWFMGLVYATCALCLRKFMGWRWRWWTERWDYFGFDDLWVWFDICAGVCNVFEEI